MNVNEAEQAIGYVFKDARLLTTAFTHSSFANEQGVESNEKLEFLGDAVLDFVVAEQLYYGGGDEGDMTVRRAELVSKKPLAEAVERLGLMQFLRLGNGAAAEEASEKLKSNLFETVTAAVYLDGGLEAAKKFILNHLTMSDAVADHKTALQELLQAGAAKLSYRDRQESKFPPLFISHVLLDGRDLGCGKGRTKKEAEQQAAAAALKKLQGEEGKVER